MLGTEKSSVVTYLKLAGVGYLTSPGKRNAFSLCFPPIVKTGESESKHLNSFLLFLFICWKYNCLRYFRKGKKLSREPDTKPARTLLGVSISQSNTSYENEAHNKCFTVVYCTTLLMSFGREEHVPGVLIGCCH